LTLEKNSPDQYHLWRRLVRYGFRLLYNEMAWTYDAVSWAVSLGQWREWQRTGLSFLVGRHVLELAHGPGHMLLELEASGFKPVGLDLSEAMGRIAGARLHRAGKNVPLIRASAYSLPFVTEIFDSVLATFPTEFIVDERTISSLYRALKPDGRLVIVPEARLMGGGPLRGGVEWLYRVTGQRGFPDGKEPQGDPWHLAGMRFVAAGFRLQVEQVELEGSIVTVVVAHKPAN
jgi:SAM-dependent methyltransferase